MSTHALPRHAVRDRGLSPQAARQARWLGAGLVLGFLVPFLLADVLGLQRDLYYGLYAVFVAGFFALWARASGQSIPGLLARRWRLAVLLGLVVAALLAVMVLRVDDPTGRPGGLTLLGALAWRGVVYGAADGLLLSAFPILAVFGAFEPERRRTWRAKTAVGLLAVVASLGMTASYHLGYSDFRSGKVRSPLVGDVVWSVPTLVTLNPVGAPIAHIGMHTTAVLHSYRTETFLPPHR